MQIARFHILHVVLLLGILLLIVLMLMFIKFPAGTISLAYGTKDNFHVVSVKARKLKYPFFGTAFHLHYDPNLYSYDRFTLGNYFEPEDSPLVLVNESSEKGTLIIGISLKRGTTINKPAGSLITLYFKGDLDNSPELAFSNTVFSTFDKERKDVKDVIFENTY